MTRTPMGEVPDRVALIKLGGSILTQKRILRGIRHDVLKRLAKELATAAHHVRLIIVHGGGSFGHPLARVYHLYGGRTRTGPGVVTDKKWHREGASAVQRSMLRLNAQLIGALVEEGLPAVSVPGGILVELEDGDLTDFHPGSITRYLGAGLVPVTFGDIASDHHRGLAIVSGDTLVLALARSIRPDVVVFATDVDGIYDADPTVDKKADLVRSADASKLRRLAAGLTDGSAPTDATGGMVHKILELAEIADLGIPALVLNGLESGRVESGLCGDPVLGTRILATEPPVAEGPEEAAARLREGSS
ncbi:MAG: isopentenyl phosphate kinase family protein [Euryarchaeota archaeon]|nr:isopentenyl phosphate kinase family protein [Euryarchaeota archaeon]